MKKRITIESYTCLSLILVLMLISCGGKESKTEAPPVKQTETETSEKSPRIKLSQGEKAFLLCTACHSLKQGEPHKVGPNLHKIFGRKAASLTDFNYSEALKGSGIVWNEDHIRTWLEKPTEYVPGTTMAFIGLQDKEKQDALIEYLKEQTK